ncbi:MAG: DegT/DnrJ/EryC1/StrS family aminotransferase, partial [Chitinophagales bacterium]|nr:DegT/DnrJ/EryC1/StrS family aminotransferase [Chitinophagales bacterium]
VEVVALLGLKPVLVDVDTNTFGMNIEQVKAAITPKTKAIIPVHLFGQCMDIESLMKLANEHQIPVIEDNAQAIGAEYRFEDGRVKKAGTVGHIGTTSFFPAKNLGCMGDGGAIFTNDDKLNDKIRMLANHGQSSLYQFEIIGCNSRLDSLQAGILRVKLRYLDQYCDARRAAADYYDDQFNGEDSITVPFRDPKSTHVFHQYTLKVDPEKRDGLRTFLNENGIPCGVYYPMPMHHHGAYRNTEFKDASFEVSEELCKSVISLPMHTELTKEIQDHIIHHVKNYLQN